MVQLLKENNLKGSIKKVMELKTVDINVAQCLRESNGNASAYLKENDINMANLEIVGDNKHHVLYGYDNMARSIQEFMYEGRPRRSKKKVHTPAEFEKFLFKLMEQNWENYNRGMRELEG